MRFLRWIGRKMFNNFIFQVTFCNRNSDGTNYFWTTYEMFCYLSLQKVFFPTLKFAKYFFKPIELNSSNKFRSLYFGWQATLSHLSHYLGNMSRKYITIEQLIAISKQIKFLKISTRETHIDFVRRYSFNASSWTLLKLTFSLKPLRKP